jgi:hypothetical protein
MKAVISFNIFSGGHGIIKIFEVTEVFVFSIDGNSGPPSFCGAVPGRPQLPRMSFFCFVFGFFDFQCEKRL